MKSKFLIFIHCFFVLLLLAGATLVWAEEINPTPTPGTEVTATPKPVTVTSADNRLATAISNAYKINVSGQDIAGLRVNQKLGYGEIGLLYGLANASGKTGADILALRQSDMGWGEIAKSLGLKVSDMMSKNTSVLKAAKMPKEDQKLNNQLKNETKGNETNPKPTKAVSGKTNSNSNSQANSNSQTNSNSETKNNSGNGNGKK